MTFTATGDGGGGLWWRLRKVSLKSVNWSRRIPRVPSERVSQLTGVNCYVRRRSSNEQIKTNNVLSDLTRDYVRGRFLFTLTREINTVIVITVVVFIKTYDYFLTQVGPPYMFKIPNKIKTIK